MEAIIYVVIFIIGATFGSFYTLATYRIPKKQDIVSTRSYCPNCNHKLGFFDMLPILSYIFLGAKCQYCKQKISPRYILLEIFSGFVFVATFYTMKISFSNIYSIDLAKICQFGFFSLYITFIFLTAGIDKENRKIEKGVTVFGVIISLMYIAYLCIVEKANIYRYAIYIVLYILALILDTIRLKKYAKSEYLNQLIILIITMAIFTEEIPALISVIATIIVIALKSIYSKIKSQKTRQRNTENNIIKTTNIAFIMCTTNILSYLILNFIK